MRILSVIAAFIFLLVCQGAQASADSDQVSGIWALDQKSHMGGYALPFLSPGNDSRFNLQMLMQDEAKAGKPQGPANLDRPMLFANFDINLLWSSDGLNYQGLSEIGATKKSVFNDSEGSRCASFESGRAALLAALDAEHDLSDAERNLLIDARSQIPSDRCPDNGDASLVGDPLVSVAQPSAAARDFADYIIGVSAFYSGSYDEASARFGNLAKARNLWLRETASYMVGRTLLNKAQTGAFDDFDGTAQPKGIDNQKLKDSETAFNAYLAAYPAGQYAASARGLLRRLYWLGGDRQRLSTEYTWLINHAGDPQANLGLVDIAQEVDAKYFTNDEQPHGPILLAVADLKRLRKTGADESSFPAADLDAQAPDFAGHESLFSFLKAARAYYVDRDYNASMQLLGAPPAEPPAPSYVGFSREVLRGQILIALGQYQQAEILWRQLLPQAAKPWQKETLELGLALTWEKAGTFNKVFAAQTRLDARSIRAIALQRVAGPILLRQAVADPQTPPDERGLALYVLLFKEATRGHYSGFLKDFRAATKTSDDSTAPDNMKFATFQWKGVRTPYICPSLEMVISELAADPRNAHGLLCLGEFIRTSDLDFVEFHKIDPAELGNNPIFLGEKFSRGDVYRQLITDAATPDKERAYALFRAINCYAPTGYNSCGGKDVAKEQRKAWFNQLKQNYGAFPWAKKLQYYW